MSEYQELLRAEVAKAQENATREWDQLNRSDDHPMSEAYKMQKTMATVAAGQAAGLMRALELAGAEVNWSWSPNR